MQRSRATTRSDDAAPHPHHDTHSDAHPDPDARRRPRPAPAAASRSGPPRSTPRGSDVGDALQRFVDGVPDGSTIVFRSGGTYRMDHGLRLAGRHDLVFEGNGATLQTTGRADSRQPVPRRCGARSASPSGTSPWSATTPTRARRTPSIAASRTRWAWPSIGAQRHRDRQRQHEALLRRLRVHRGRRQHHAWSRAHLVSMTPAAP